ncbi:DUF7683 domain-containing protein [Geminocystis herdmanii]|uniref:DUF7683 domain-containing protein n=1 Tax=Geminocystis herdmanii TaxID=669359 RepID=UPI00034CC1E4|nr:hypothetical protein [Geminocystis herdmanii]
MIKRFFRSFDKNGEDLVGEKPLNNLNLEELQKLFKVDSNNPMYDCYLIENKEQFDYLQNKFNVKLNDELYDYYLETDTFSEDN